MASVLHLSFSDSGGAGSAAYAFHKSLVEQGISSKLCVKSKSRSDDSVFSMSKDSRLTRKINKFKGWLNGLLFDPVRAFYGVFDAEQAKSIQFVETHLTADVRIVVVHWVSNFLSSSDLRKLLVDRDIKVYWIVMDMAPFTGGCHFSFGCDGYKRGCDNCPGAKTALSKRIVQHKASVKVEAIRDLDVTLLCFNRRTQKQALDAFFPFSSVKLVSPPIDKSEFSVDGSGELEDRPPRIFVGAYNPSDARKGFSLLFDILEALLPLLGSQIPTVELFVPEGVSWPELKGEGSVYEKVHYPFAKTDKELANLYRQCDLFLSTSIDDSGPLMISQSILCGVPFVASDVGVSEELSMYDEKLGKTFHPDDPEAAARFVFECLSTRKEAEERGYLVAKSALSYYEHFAPLEKVLHLDSEYLSESCSEA